MNIQTLNDFNFKFNKSFGQNFIFDTNFLKSIVSAVVTPSDTVLEIGAGAGTLTSMLASTAKRVISFEIDQNLKPILKENLKDYKNCEVVFEDIMKIDIARLEEKLGEEYIIVANLPYYITTPIIFKFLENAKNLKSMAIMVQMEVAERIVAPAGSKNYGAITPAIDYRANAKIIKKVGRHMFTPVPNVDSAIVKIDFVKDKYNILDSKTLDETIKCVFAMRRKTIANNLKSTFHFSQEDVEEVCSKANISFSARGETLNTEQLVNLSNEIFKFKQK